MHDEHCHRFRVIHIQLWQCRIQRLICGDRYDVGIVGEQQRLARLLAMHLQFRERLVFEAFHKDDVAGENFFSS